MYIVDGIAYAGEKAPVIKVSGVRPLEGNRLWLRFNTGEAKIFDFTALLDQPAFSPLSDPEVFRGCIYRLRRYRVERRRDRHFPQLSL